MKKLLLIINPVAGMQRIHSDIYDIISEFCASDYEVTVQITKERGHGKRLAADAKKNGFDIVVCAGGDGTLNEAISGLLEADPEDSLPLGYIPAGSTNDFAATLGLPSEAARAARVICRGDLNPIDIGKFGEDKFFSYIATFGAFSAASYDAPQELKNTIGHAAYILEGLKNITGIESCRTRVVADGKEYSGDYIFCSVSNTHSVAGIVKLKDNIVDLHDGKFEVILVKKPRNILEVNEILTKAISSNLSGDMFEFFKASDITFTMENDVPWSLDGEKAEPGKTVRIRNLPSAVQLCL